MEGDAMPQTARVRQLVEDIEAEAKDSNMSVRHAAALRWAQEGGEQNSFTAHEWADALVALQERTLSEGGTPIGVRDLREDAPASEASRGVARLQDTSGPGGQGAVEYRSEAMEALVAARLKQLSDSGRPADRMSVITELVNSGRVKTEGPGGGTRMSTPTVGA